GRVALEGLDRGGDQAVEVAAGEPHADVAHVDAEADAPGDARGVRHAGRGAGHAPRAIISRTAVRASATFSGWPPPPWAMSALPPPRPPTAPAPVRSSVPATWPASRAAALVAMTREARPLSWPATATTTGESSPSRARRSSARVRRS